MKWNLSGSMNERPLWHWWRWW